MFNNRSFRFRNDDNQDYAILENLSINGGEV